MKIFSRIVSLSLCMLFASRSPCQNPAKRPFTVRDDIEFAQFGDPFLGDKDRIIPSPEGDKVIVHTTRGSLKDDSVRDELRVYDIARIRRFVDSPQRIKSLEPVWKVEEAVSSPDNLSSVITSIRWFRTGTGFAFLLETREGEKRLVIARLRNRSLETITPASQNVLAFDIRDESHLVYCVAAAGGAQGKSPDRRSPVSVGTGRSLYDLAFGEETPAYLRRAEVWSLQGRSSFPVVNRATKQRFIVFEDGIDALSLSPDGRFLITVRPFEDVPKEWEKLYPPPYSQALGRIRAGQQDLQASLGLYVGDYVRIDLDAGEVESLTDAPEAVRTGWWEPQARPEWSTDGSSVVLPGTFVKGANESVPCILVVHLQPRVTECVRHLHRNLADGFESGYDPISEVSFEPGSSGRVIVTGSFARDGHGPVKTLFARSPTGTWNQERLDPKADKRFVDLEIAESYKDPPLLVATDRATGAKRTVFDPNPQLKAIELGKAESYRWTDSTGKSWQGILYLPPDYQVGIRYPLVIENHGFTEDRFRPSGGFPSAFAARELAGAGIVVLHARDCPGRSTSFEGACNVEEYKTAVDTLANAGMIDPSRVGLIGFSRTVFYALETLTSGELPLAAASITDGISAGYMEYLLDVPDDYYLNDAEALIGAAPFGDGLNRWVKTAPDFNLGRITSPLRVVARTGSGLLGMWEPYAVLARLDKPVDLIVLATHQHVFYDPEIRMAAQGGNVDWFRFWLQGYEDPDPSKAQQYKRWEKMRRERGVPASDKTQKSR